jgi:hypothetical protein
MISRRRNRIPNKPIGMHDGVSTGCRAGEKKIKGHDMRQETGENCLVDAVVKVEGVVRCGGGAASEAESPCA